MQRLCVIVGASDECLHSLTEALHSHEVRAIGVSDARAALRLFEQMHVDAVVLNADALGYSAFQALLALVKQRYAPVVVLATARDEIDQILALEMGAADFIAKPASPRFVLAKVKRLLDDHAVLANPLATSARLGPVHMAGDLTTLTVDNTTVRLTRVEFAMLRLLLVRYGHAVSRETTARFIGAAGTSGIGGRSIDALVSRIRLRLRSAGIDNVRIESVRGTGYYLVIDGVTESSFSEAGQVELDALAA
ncbi:MAG TPA: response regulator transcription factor [Burkholderiaceae bacterium]|nr:response regulator transcription factor [Burkholderiaceae bacterium]